MASWHVATAAEAIAAAQFARFGIDVSVQYGANHASEHASPSPTIASLKAGGLTGVYPVCRACHHSGAVAFDAIGLPDETPFPRIARARRFRCSACGARDYAVVPDWRGYRAPGMGRV